MSPRSFLSGMHLLDTVEIVSQEQARILNTANEFLLLSGCMWCLFPAHFIELTQYADSVCGHRDWRDSPYREQSDVSHCCRQARI